MAMISAKNVMFSGATVVFSLTIFERSNYIAIVFILWSISLKMRFTLFRGWMPLCRRNFVHNFDKPKEFVYVQVLMDIIALFLLYFHFASFTNFWRGFRIATSPYV